MGALLVCGAVPGSAACCAAGTAAWSGVLEDVMADGNRHFEHKYFTIRERIEKGEIIPYWISGKENPSDLLTKATDKGAVDALLPYMNGTKEIPIPEGLQVWFGPIESPELRGNPKQS